MGEVARENQEIWFQDGCHAHFGLHVRIFLDDSFPMLEKFPARRTSNTLRRLRAHDITRERNGDRAVFELDWDWVYFNSGCFNFWSWHWLDSGLNWYWVDFNSCELDFIICNLINLISEGIFLTLGTSETSRFVTHFIFDLCLISRHYIKIFSYRFFTLYTTTSTI
jgi:hypothetical protein